jgi:ubiquinone/menaquinone biosynthesis C-methylase UbiE
MSGNKLEAAIEANKQQLRERVQVDERFIHCHWSSQRTLVGFIPPTARTILDIGCGPLSAGLTAFLRDMDYIGIDFVHSYLAEARRQEPEFGPFEFSRRRWLLAPMESLPFADAAFDVVYSRHAIEHSLDLHSTLQEIRRVLQPGGIFIFCVPSRVDDVEPTHTMRWPARKWLATLGAVGKVRFWAQHDYFIDELYGYIEKPGKPAANVIVRASRRANYLHGQGILPDWAMRGLVQAHRYYRDLRGKSSRATDH